MSYVDSRQRALFAAQLRTIAPEASSSILRDAVRPSVATFAPEELAQLPPATASESPDGKAFLPPPDPELSGPPLGQGLVTSPAGWPNSTVRTAGGFHIVPGDQGGIFSPGQTSTEAPAEPLSGDRLLSDGSRLYAHFSSEAMDRIHAFDIVHGMDHVRIQQRIRENPDDPYGVERAQGGGITAEELPHLYPEQFTAVQKMREVLRHEAELGRAVDRSVAMAIPPSAKDELDAKQNNPLWHADFTLLRA